MYKSKLQELCQQKHWSLPQYSTTKEGPSHGPRFTTTITVNGISFVTPNPSRSTKESHNDAAMLAFQHFSDSLLPPDVPPIISPTLIPPAVSPVILPRPSEPLIVAAPPNPPAPDSTDDLSEGLDTILAGLRCLQPKLPEEYLSTEMRMAEGRTLPLARPPEECHAPLANQSTPHIKEDAPSIDLWHLSKSQLQMYAQKSILPLPTYSCEHYGPAHISRFKCKVNIDGQTFESPDYCSTLKDAENAAARVALLAMSATGDQERDSGLYKNLLQELAQKEGYRLPVYKTMRAIGLFPTFTSTVMIEGESFTGQPEKTKKQAESSAAKVAYTTLIECKWNRTSTSHCSTKQGSCILSSPSTSSQQTPNISTNVSPGVNAHLSLAHLAKRINGGRDDIESTSHNHPSPPHEATTAAKKEGSWSDSLLGQVKNLSLEESSSELSSSKNGNMATATASAFGYPGQAVSLPPPGVVRVYPRALNMTLPSGSVVTVSDDSWIAVCADPI
ncbi:hypothetical protein SAY86_017664 [Trapa natans]|uniref:DRBM domain-containing protein n=1 Tax=Trapa natans TaxID=22666 RepID=A0AAN7M6M6_TRANT|nr:hypothetical protein SAY86_017664 [Trapa natans]